MSKSHLFAHKSLETLLEEMKGENRLRRVLGPIALTSLGVGAIIGAGIFVATGAEAANKAGPAVMVSFVVAGLGCALAALCYAEFASLAPVAGSAYTYAYATLGELFAWIIGWDLVLEYAMSCGVLASDWTYYFNVFLKVCFGEDWVVPKYLSNNPFTVPGAWFSLPAVLIMAAATVVLVIGIRESATTNAVLVITKVGVVLFVIGVGIWYISPGNWTGVPVAYRKMTDVPDLLQRYPEIGKHLPAGDVRFLSGSALLEKFPGAVDIVSRSIQEKIKALGSVSQLRERPDLLRYLPDQNYQDMTGRELLQKDPKLRDEIKEKVELEIKKLPSDEGKWGAIALLGLHHWLEGLDDQSRSPFMPYGLSGILVASAVVFFAYLGFDAISTHSEEARRPQRDVPFGILASLILCTVLYLGVSAVITGMEPYPIIDEQAAVAEAFHRLSKEEDSLALRMSAGLIATGALAGMTSVILITLLSQARIFLAMARDGLLPPAIFGAVHPRFRTPHRSTMLTGGILCVVTALVPLEDLLNMVNIGTLLAFIIVCFAVLLLRIRRPDANRPFRCPAVYLIAPLGVAVNLVMMLFLPVLTWLRLILWLVLGLIIYYFYGYRHSVLGKQLAQLPQE
jgi:APA family basic amino acid/polyamine antiporter